MPRMRRLKVMDGEGWYHVYSRTACEKGVYPLDKDLCRQRFIQFLKYYSRAYFCDVAAFCVMGNHYHIVLKFEIPRKLTEEDLWQRAILLYPKSKRYLKLWDRKNPRDNSRNVTNWAESSGSGCWSRSSRSESACFKFLVRRYTLTFRLA